MSPSHGGRDGAVAPPAASGDGLTLSVGYDVDATAAGVRATRTLIRSALAEWEVDPATANAALDITHELLANAVGHGHPPVAVSLQCTATYVLVAVTDGSQQPARRLPYRPGLSEHGLGLRLVAQLSVDWGQRQVDGAGKQVWARIRRRSTVA